MIIWMKGTIQKIWREKSLPSKWNCLRSGFLARGGAGQLKLHSGTQLRERGHLFPLSFKLTYLACKEKYSLLIDLAKLNFSPQTLVKSTLARRHCDCEAGFLQKTILGGVIQELVGMSPSMTVFYAPSSSRSICNLQ